MRTIRGNWKKELLLKVKEETVQEGQGLRRR
jgi:hypothetical protein